jgi:hypothetical protein
MPRRAAAAPCINCLGVLELPHASMCVPCTAALLSPWQLYGCRQLRGSKMPITHVSMHTTCVTLVFQLWQPPWPARGGCTNAVSCPVASIHHKYACAPSLAPCAITSRPHCGVRLTRPLVPMLAPSVLHGGKVPVTRRPVHHHSCVIASRPNSGGCLSRP